MPYADDTSSIFSSTTTIYDAPHLLQDGSNGFVAPDQALPLSPEQTFATVVLSWQHWKPDQKTIDLLGRVGCPATMIKGTGLKVLAKRLSLQIPRQLLLESPTYHRNPKTTAEARELFDFSKKNAKRMGTLLDHERCEFLNMRERETLGQVISTLLRAIDVQNPTFTYPTLSVVDAPKWARLKSPTESAAASADVKWATLSILSPPLEGDSNAVSKEQEKAFLSEAYGNNGGKAPKTDEELLAQFWQPTDAAEIMLDKILETLDRRGAVWTHAAHRSTPGLRNPDPKARPEFAVLGVFPTLFLERCKKYAANDRKPMPSDLDDVKKGGKDAPLQTSVRGVGADDDADSFADGLAGCSVRFTEEPYRASTWRTSGYATLTASGF